MFDFITLCISASVISDRPHCQEEEKRSARRVPLPGTSAARIARLATRTKRKAQEEGRKDSDAGAQEGAKGSGGIAEATQVEALGDAGAGGRRAAKEKGEARSEEDNGQAQAQAYSEDAQHKSRELDLAAANHLLPHDRTQRLAS